MTPRLQMVIAMELSMQDTRLKDPPWESPEACWVETPANIKAMYLESAKGIWDAITEDGERYLRERGLVAMH